MTSLPQTKYLLRKFWSVRAFTMILKNDSSTSYRFKPSSRRFRVLGSHPKNVMSLSTSDNAPKRRPPKPSDGSKITSGFLAGLPYFVYMVLATAAGKLVGADTRPVWKDLNAFGNSRVDVLNSLTNTISESGRARMSASTLEWRMPFFTSALTSDTLALSFLLVCSPVFGA